MKFWIVLLALWAALPADLAWGQTPPPGTVLEPRSKTDYEKHLAELNARYGADKSQSALKDAVLKANGVPDKAMPGAAGANRVALPADLVPGQKLRIELLPHGEREFLFQDEVYDSLALAEALAGVKRGYVIDQVILLNSPERPIQIDHLLELARIGRDLELLTAYQQGDELKLISAK
jgi:hypothetical protein